MPKSADVPRQLLGGQLATAEQAQIIELATQPHPLLVVHGGPGTGKTTTLTNCVLRQVAAGTALEEILVVTGSRSAAQRMRADLVAGVGRTVRRPNVMTIHGLAQAILQRANPPGQVLPELLTGPEQDARLREMLRSWPVERWPQEMRLAVPTRGFAAQLRALLARARQLGLDPDELTQIGRHADRPEIAVAGEFFAEYLDVLDSAGVLDYAELVHRARLALADSKAVEFAAPLQTIYVDELAELDRAQTQLLADLVRLGAGFVGFADATTNVFGFRGADARLLGDFEQSVAQARPDARLQVLRLTEQLRGQDSTHWVDLRAANRSVARRLGERTIETATSIGDGVQVLVAPNDQLAAEQIADRLRRAHADGMAWEQMAVITRAGHATLGQLARRLSGAGVPVQVWGDEVALRAEPAVKTLLDALTASSQMVAGEAISAGLAESLLRSPLAGPTPLDLRALGRELRNRARTEVVAEHQLDDEAEPWQIRVRPAAELIAAELTEPTLLANVAENASAMPELNALSDLHLVLADAARRLREQAAPADVLWQLWSATQWPDRLQQAALSGGDGAQRANRALDAVIALFDLANRAAEFVGLKGLRMLLEQVEAQQIAADTARESDPRGRGVALLTAHRAKGLEWPLVVVTGLQEGLWPRTSVPPQLLGADLLSSAGLTTPRTAAELIAADRRAFLLSISRASDSLLVVANAGDDGEGNRPSRFIYELGVPVLDAKREELPQPLATLDVLVAQLRRTAADPSQPPGLRQGAVRLLAQLAEERDERGYRLVEAADPRSWWGLVDYTPGESPIAEPGRPIRLTGSELETLLACPRSWFLARRAKAETTTSTAAGLGSIIHTLAQHALAEELSIEQLRSAVDDIWDQVPFDAAWLSVSERSEVDAALERLQVWSQANSDRRVVGVEVPFDVVVEIDDQDGGHDTVQLVGAVDRLEISGEPGNERLRIVDFKTGRSEPTAAQAAQSDQLGVYQLAAQHGAFDELVGDRLPLADAELVYLRSKAKDQISPKTFTQPSLDERPWPLSETATSSGSWVHERLAQAARVVRSEDFSARANPRCQFCAFKVGCPAIGAKR